MKAFIIEKEQISAWLDSLAASRRVFMPKRNPRNDRIVFAERSPGEAPDFQHLTTTTSAKGLFFPQTEPMMHFAGKRGEVSLEERLPEEEPRAIFGIRPCDARALLALDEVFAKEDPDPYYRRRRQSTALIAVACLEPRAGCFCEALPGFQPAWDLRLVELSDAFLVEAETPVGAELAAAASLSEAGPDRIAEAQERLRKFADRFPTKLDVETVSDKLPGLWEDPLWIELSRRCIGCAACTYLCPTCHCFDIQDETAGITGVRFRCWDTCQERDFTAMGAGHNPRPTRKERHRQRVMHKFAYFPRRFGMTACVGCGRCVEACPVNIDIREVVARIASMPDTGKVTE